MPNSASSGRLNVLHIASWFPSKMSAQNGNFIQRHIAAISRKTNGFLLHVVSDTEAKEYDASLEQLTDYQSVIVTYPKGNVFNRFARNKKAHHVGYQKIKPICSKLDLIHLHVMFPAVSFAQELAKDLNIPIVVTEHATAYHNYHPQTYNWWQRIFLKRYSRSVKRYFPVSSDLWKSMMDKGIRGDYKVIPNVVDTSLFFSSQTERSKDHFEFIHISSLKDEHKNVSGLLSVFTEVVEQHPQARLTIIGNDHHEQIQRYINLLKLSSQVTLLREMPIEAVAQYLQKSHALVLFSNYENAPCVISEAHCVGIPVVATDVGGVREMVDEANGLLVSSGDVFGMYAALCKMIDQYDQYNHREIHQTASSKYGYDIVGQQYLEQYIDVLSRK